jgi:predicted ATPase/DNA-binding XRE family transcriptional regulator
MLKRYRLDAGLTHESLAERAGLSARAISDLERGVTQAPRRDTLKLLADALRLTDDQRAALEAAARPRPAPSERPRPEHNLPAQLTSFVGREREIGLVLDLLRRPDTRLVTLTGPGGTGKTRLAIRVAEELLDDVPDGIFFVALAPVADAPTIIQALAQALGVGGGPGHALEAGVADYLRDRRSLLLLDNFEHLLSGAPLVSRLLARCRDVKVLVTSRSALRLSGEQEFPLEPLPLPDLRRPPPASELAQNAAVALFVERAARARPGFALSADNAAALVGICVRLDGLPLAIELAAARVKLLPPPALLARLEGSSALRLLTDGARDLPARQQTLRATIGWSYDLLAPAEQRLFARVAIFVGGCDLEAAEAVCGDGPPEGDAAAPLAPLDIEVIDGVASLVDKSLLRQEEGVGDEPRFAMLDTIREFGLERLAAAGEAAELRARHARHYLAMVEAGGPFLLASELRQRRLAAEQDNVRTALRWLVEQG